MSILKDFEMFPTARNGKVCVMAMSGSQIWSFHTGYMYSYIILKHLIVAIIMYQLDMLKHFMTLIYI